MAGLAFLRNAVRKTRLIDVVHNVRWKRIVNQFDTKTQRFKNIDRVATKIGKKYGEDVYDQLAERYIYNYISRYHDEIAETAKRLKEEIQPVSQDFTVFSMWWQGEKDMPPVVKACIHSLEKVSERVVVITKENYADYASLPDYIVSLLASGKMGFAHFSDIIRTYLLVKYGGVWIDSTVYIAREVPAYMTDDFFVFKQSPQLRECRSFANWWIASPPANDILIEELAYLYCYWRHHDVAMHYYIYHIFFRKIIDEKPAYKNRIDAIPTRITDSTHMLHDSFPKPFDVTRWSIIKDISPVFKCSLKMKENYSHDTFYSRLCNNQLD